MKRRPSPAIAWVMALALAGLSACQASPTAPSAPATGPAPGAPAPAAGLQAPDAGATTGAALAKDLVIDVDPFHGAAFERPNTENGDLKLALALPGVSYDPQKGQVTVTAQVTNAGATLANVNAQVQGDAQLVSPPPDAGLLAASGGAQTFHLVFNDPNGDGFSFHLHFDGAAATRQLMATTGVTATADSSYSGTTPGMAVDGDLSTQWANGGYKASQAWLQLDTGSVQTLGSLAVKMQPLSGAAYYQIEVSSDGSSFSPVTGHLTNTTWGVETKALPAGTQGRYVRLHFFNDPSAPMTRFSVFEAQVSSSGSSSSSTPTPAPTTGTSPTPAPTSAPSSAPNGSGWVASASSSYGTLTPDKAIDGDLSTQWANDGYEAPEAWLAVDLGQTQAISTLSVKMAPQSGGSYYRIEVSSDGVSYTPVGGNFTNSSWNVETKALPAGTQGRYVRLHFYNDPASPEVRFMVFELQVGGSSNPAPAPSPTPTPMPTPTPTPSSTTTSGSLNDTFEQDALGSDPSDFIDPNDEGYSYSWMPRVPWRIVNYNGSHAYEAEGLSNTANLNFRRYRGTALGSSNGVLPNRYFASVDETPIQSYTYQPTGDQGTQFYYLDPTHYVELQIKPTYFEVWLCNGGQPFQSAGWQRVCYKQTSNAAGQTHHLEAWVDTYAHSIRVNFDNGAYTDSFTDSSGSDAPLLTPTTHYFSLRCAGNNVAYDNLVIQPN